MPHLSGLWMCHGRAFTPKGALGFLVTKVTNNSYCSSEKPELFSAGSRTAPCSFLSATSHFYWCNYFYSLSFSMPASSSPGRAARSAQGAAGYCAVAGHGDRAPCKGFLVFAAPVLLPGPEGARAPSMWRCNAEGAANKMQQLESLGWVYWFPLAQLRRAGIWLISDISSLISTPASWFSFFPRGSIPPVWNCMRLLNLFIDI